MDSGQVVFLLLTLMICYDLVELYEVQKRFKRAVKSFNNLAQSGLYGIADELNSSRKKAEHYERQIRSIKLKFMLKMLTKFMIECLTQSADYPIVILDFCLIIFAVVFWFNKSKWA